MVPDGTLAYGIQLPVQALSLCFTAEAMAARGLPVPCADASVAGADRDRDLAILFLNGSTNLPYLPLGDSDVVVAGLPVEALGYPFGREVEIGKVGAASDLVPDVSATPGLSLHFGGATRESADTCRSRTA